MEAAARTQTISTNETMDTLEALAKDAADNLRSYINNVDLEKYKNFLYFMYHYTMYSEDKLRTAADSSHTEELVEYFNHMAKEERGHYILAREDLKELGEEVSDYNIPMAVVNFNNEWDKLGKYGSFGYLGAVFVFENVAKHLQQEGGQMLAKLNLGKTQCRWVAVHLEADLEHGEEIREMCEKYVAEGSDKIIAGAKIMHKSWLEVFTEAFS